MKKDSKKKLLEKLDAFEAQCIKKLGWYGHFVFNDDQSPSKTNIHTHGLTESMKHKDIQICIPMPHETAQWILNQIVHNIKEGFCYEAGKEYDNVLKGYKVRVLAAVECGRHVLRFCLPDKDGEFKGKFAEQLTKLNNEQDKINEFLSSRQN